MHIFAKSAGFQGGLLDLMMRFCAADCHVDLSPQIREQACQSESFLVLTGEPFDT